MKDNERVITDKNIKSNNEELNSNKQIEEMAKHITVTMSFLKGEYIEDKDFLGLAIGLYDDGYRKERQGEWFIREYEFFTCSECGHDYWNSCDCTKEAKERLAEGDTPNYCPNCGAKMKGE